MSEIVSTPEWLDAADWIANNAQYGDLLPHEWLCEKFKLNKPKYGTQEDFDRFSFEYLQNITSLSQYLLEEHSIALQNVRGRGYRVVPPEEQVDVAKKQAKAEIHRAVRKYAAHLEHIRYDELSVEKQRERDDEAAKLSQMRQMMRRQLEKK